MSNIILKCSFKKDHSAKVSPFNLRHVFRKQERKIIFAAVFTNLRDIYDRGNTQSPMEALNCWHFRIINDKAAPDERNPSTV